MKNKSIHFFSNDLLNPTNPITINLIGTGGTGSEVLHFLARMNGALLALNHPGFFVKVFDNDVVNSPNINRQRFSQEEIGYNKATSLVTRINRFYGTNWKGINIKFNRKTIQNDYSRFASNITLTCVDTIAARIEIAGILRNMGEKLRYQRYKPFYWIDFGNDKNTGQVILSTVSKVPQPKSEKYVTVPTLPFVTDSYKCILNEQKSTEKNTPSCSLAEALTRQDLLINPTIANAGCSLLWNLIRTGMTKTRGIFVNVKTHHMLPMLIN